jgi:large subunit ribosomal protein L29
VKAKEIRDMNDEALEAALRDAREAIFNLRFQNVTGTLERTSELGLRRRDIARMLTVANERGLLGG